MALLEINWDDPDQDFLTGLIDDIPPFTLPAATWPRVPNVFPRATLDEHGGRLRRFSAHGAYNYGADPERPVQAARLEALNAGAPDDPVEGATRPLWRLLCAAVRADHMTEGLMATHLPALTRLANELRRRELADRTAGWSLSRVVDPFEDLPDSPPYRYWADQPTLEANTDRVDDHLEDQLRPTSFLGNPVTARVVLLSLNPGFAEQDELDEDAPASAAARERGNFHDDSVFEVLRPEFERQSGATWWRQRTLAGLLRHVDADTVMRGIAAVEWFPYHSKTFRDLRNVLPSQQLAFRLVHNAVRRGAVIVSLRSWRRWVTSVPILETAPVIHLRNRRRLYVSQGNMEHSQFQRIIDGLKHVGPQALMPRSSMPVSL